MVEMAKKGEDGPTILDMDFGDFISPDENFTNPPTPEDTTKKVEEPVEEEDAIDLKEALASQVEEEEEEVKVEEDDVPEDSTKKIDDPEPPVSSDDEPFTLVLARYQLEQGVLSSLDEDALKDIIEKEGEAAAFSYLIQNEVETNSKAVSEKLDDYTKEYNELRKAGFDSGAAGNTIMTLEALDSISDDDLQSEDNEELRRTILKENYKATTSFSESKIDRLVKRAFDINADVEDAQEALESLRVSKKEELVAVKAEKEAEQQAAQDAYNEQIATLSKHIDSLNEIVPGKKINKQTKDKIKDMITKPVKQSEDGYAMNAIWSKRNDNPVEFDSILSYLVLSGVFDGKWDQITRTVNTKLTNKLEERLKTGSGSSLLGGKHVTRREQADNTRNDMIGPMKQLLGED